ncbi:MAG: 16S rRNA (uracil(1498)-N(3))-methyltransferase [Candidatus Omnitrophica bacterium]|nr:16S rRNA (uracil(1498)-N(3))-methyltransferase [Candidatus Omnitrophota bacterium]
MSRFYCPPEKVREGAIYLDGDEAHHIYKVMRLRPDDEVVVFDGIKGYKGIITSAAPKSVVVRIIKAGRTRPESELNVSIAIGLPKGKKMDLIVQKCTELGVKEIIPMKTERSVVLPDNKDEGKKIKRWLEIARGASKQSGRIKIPAISGITVFKEVAKLSESFSAVFIGCVSGADCAFKKALKDKKPKRKDGVLFLVGPEGGFSKSEIELAKKSKISPVYLGERVLRTETAAIYVMSVINFFYD